MEKTRQRNGVYNGESVDTLTNLNSRDNVNVSGQNSKGQKISEANYLVLISSKKRTKFCLILP